MISAVNSPPKQEREPNRDYNAEQEQAPSANAAQQEQASTAFAEQPLLSPEVVHLLRQPETQQALADLLSHLPQLAQLAADAGGAYAKTQALANDPVFRQDVASGIHEIVGPALRGTQSIAAAALEAKEAAQTSKHKVGLMDMLRLWKDPSVQSALRFAQAFLAIAPQRLRGESDTDSTREDGWR